MSEKSNWIQRHPLAAYILLAYGLSWVVQIPLALQAQGWMDERLPYGLHYLTGYGPLLSAVIVTAASQGPDGLAQLWARLTQWRVGLKWWLVALSPLLAGALLSLVMGIFGAHSLNLGLLGQVDNMPALGIGSLGLWFLTFGVGEEAGWRGFLLPYLQRSRSAFKATLILWLIWAAWHTPLFFYMYDPSVLPGLLLGLLAGAIVFTWIYNSTEGSVLMTIVWHTSFNFMTACTACKAGSTSAVISTLVMVWAVWVVLRYRPAKLSVDEKSILPIAHSHTIA